MIKRPCYLFYMSLIVSSLFLFSCQEDKLSPEEEGVEQEDEKREHEEDSEILRLVNELRNEGCRCGSENYAPTNHLTWNDKLEQAAKRHSNDMNQHDFMNHTGSDGSRFTKRITDTGYRYRAAAENIASNPGNASQVFQAWKNSPGHCANMMNPDFTEMGAWQSGRYWTQVFARPM